MTKNYLANKLTPRKEPTIKRLVKRAEKSKNKAIKTMVVKRFKDYEQMEINNMCRAAESYQERGHDFFMF